VAPFTLTRRPFIRDCICYLTATIYLFFIMLKGYITQAESAVFLIFYILYVCVVVFGRKIYQSHKKRRLSQMSPEDVAAVNGSANGRLDDDDDDDVALLNMMTNKSGRNE
jgi:Ca2+/Na+ antiporter